MSLFMKSGDAFIPTQSRESLLEGLPVGVYTLEESQTGWFYMRGEEFQEIPTLYGDISQRADRILNTFNLRTSNTGVLLSGAKGSGKSLLGRLLSERAGVQGMATILVNKKIPGPILNEELSKLEHPALVFLDEFEKVFNKDEDQEAVLGLLDGTQRSRHLFVLTVNRVSRMDDNLLNRPGRLYYHIEFNGLDASFIEDYCKRNLENIAYMSDIKRVTAMFETFNFDMLQALVQEINRYDEAPFDAVRYLNITPTAMREYFKIKAVSVNGLKPESIYPNETNVSPLQMDMIVQVYPEYKDYDNTVLTKEWEHALADNNGVTNFNVTTRDLKSFDENTGVYVFVKNGFVLTFEPKNRQQAFHWTQAF